MLLFDLTYYLTLFCLPFVIYSLFLNVNNQQSRIYTNRDWFYLIKYFYAKSAIKRYQNNYRTSLKRKKSLNSLENVKEIEYDRYTDSHFVYGIDQNGNNLSLRITIRTNQIAEINLSLRIQNGDIFTLPDNNGLKLCSLSSWQWKTKGLNLEILEPFRRLRLTFNHLLKQQQNGRLQHVRFNFIWTAGGAPKFYPQDAAIELLVDALASERWRDGNWIANLGDERGYEQFGTLRGFIKLATKNDEILLNLPSCRQRFWGTAERFSMERSVHLFIVGNDGTLVDLWMKSLRNGCRQLKYGYVLMKNGEISPIELTDLRLQFFAPYRQLPNAFTIHIRANNQTFKSVHHLKTIEQLCCISNELDGYELINIPTFCKLNTHNGRSLLELWYSQCGNGIELPQPLIKEIVTSSPIPQNGDIIINLTNPNAKMVDLTGGKGSSLAVLTSLNSDDFKVPEGFVVTSKAFRKQLDYSFNMKTAITILDDICCKRTNGNLENACLETVRLIQNEKIHPEIIEKIQEEFQRLSLGGAKRWAVRSSGIGEDSEDLSQAGQNATFLGCHDFNDIIKSISSSWASLYQYQSVQYRHQHGLPIRTEMAVIVQNMVPADCAGVVFTCHPTTLNPTEIVITANYGLGESIVSGQSDPDTIILQRSFDNNNTLTITSKMIGRKNKVIKMATDSGIIDELAANSNELCLNDEQIIKLAHICLKLDQLYDNYRDIEWAFYQNHLFLLQSRPITTLNQWNDYELNHEFDIATFSDNTIYTVANSGEVFPGAQSTLTLTTILPIVDHSMQQGVGWDLDKFRFKCLATFQHFVFLDVIGAIHKNPQDSIKLSSKIIDLTVFGHPIIDNKINRLSIDRWGVTNSWRLFKEIYRMCRLAWYNDRRLKAIKIGAENFNVGITDRDTIQEIYTKIDMALKRLSDEVLIYHVNTSGTSVFYQILAMNVLAERNTDFTIDHYNDIAELLSSCKDVISAQIPEIIERIAKILHENGKFEEFSQLKPDNVLEWLPENCPDVYQIFQEFLKEHGHRVFGEVYKKKSQQPQLQSINNLILKFDLMKKTWSMDPTQIIKIIQANSINNQNNKIRKNTKSLDDIIKNLTTPSSDITRKILRFLMVRSRCAVGIREQSKSFAVFAINKIRTAYNYLSQQMIKEGLLPRSDLIYHLSHYEIGLIVDKNRKSPALINKAMRHERLHYQQWNKQKFPEIIYGVPHLDNTDLIEIDKKFQFKGTPVCSGIVEGRACVITDLDNIDQLQSDDILITYCTDIGWSPYFPILSGIITELGGLVSHGAVVAREYGLPCIVGVRNVTKLFKTGDIVRLSGKTGTIQLISKE